MQVIAIAAVLLAQSADRPATRSFFAKDGVAFWGDVKPTKAAAVAPGSTESLWAEPIQGPDGKVTVYVPPKAVLAFLEQPTRDTAKAYLAWQGERMKRLKAAIELLRDVRAEGNGATLKAAETPPEPPKALPAPAAILYFKKADCGFCDREDAELAELVKTSPLPVETVPEGDPRWKYYGVTATPSFVVTAADGRRTLIRGFMPAAQLKKLIEEVSHGRR